MQPLKLFEFQQLYAQLEELRIRDTIGYDKMNEVLISHHSTSIEGSSLTLEEVQLLLEDGLTAKGKPLSDHNMVKDHQVALEMVVGAAKRKEPVTPALVQRIAAAVMKNTGSVISSIGGTFDSSKGEWRKGAVRVGARYFINYQSVEREVIKLCMAVDKANQAAKTLTDIYDLAFDAHFKLVSIHPFSDGNGRTSRLLMNYILAYHNMPLAMLYTDSKQDYYAALEKSREEEPPNLQPMRDFMYGQQVRFFKDEITKFVAGNHLTPSPLLAQLMSESQRRSAHEAQPAQRQSNAPKR